MSKNITLEDQKKIGKILQSSRIIQTIDKSYIAEQLRININYIIAIENGNWNEISGGDVYTKGYIKKYADILEIENPIVTVGNSKDISSTSIKKKKHSIILSHKKVIGGGSHKRRSSLLAETKNEVSKPIILVIITLIFIIIGFAINVLINLNHNKRAAEITLIKPVPARFDDLLNEPIMLQVQPIKLENSGSKSYFLQCTKKRLYIFCEDNINPLNKEYWLSNMLINNKK